MLFRRWMLDRAHRRVLLGLSRIFWRENNREARGLRLLRNWLTAEQRAQFDANRYFDVIGCNSGKRYRIRYGINSNVVEIDTAGCPKVGWCFVPVGQLVAGDIMLAQKIALETNESGALAVANGFLPKNSSATLRVPC
ncbi:hypothetical protein [Bradyrhizobium sp.]|uniref:hypothetical protein n=1 Tax=Bradyrhizobium sp. TaxID=376 RepID=UPI003BB04262